MVAIDVYQQVGHLSNHVRPWIQSQILQSKVRERSRILAKCNVPVLLKKKKKLISTSLVQSNTDALSLYVQ